MIGGTYHSCLTINSVLTLNTWQHVAATYDGSAMRIYVNGVQQASAAVSGAIDAVTDPIVIGRNVVAPDHAWQGLIDEVDLFNRALSSTEIASIYSSGSAGKCPPVSEPLCVPSPSALLGWWKGEGDGSDAAGANNSTLMSGVSFTSGKVGQAFTFNGIDSQIRFGNAVGNFDTNDFTIDFWIRTTATRLESVIEKWPVCGHASMFTVRMGGPGVGAGRLNVVMEQDDVGSNQNSLVSARQVNDGVFHHVALVRKGTSATFYIDGILDSTASSSGITHIRNSVDLVAGRSVCVGIDGTANFTGQLDEISVYNRALAASEIQGIYNAGGAGKCATQLLPARALAHWKFDEPNGSIAHDSAGSHNGTLSSSGASFDSGGISGGALRLSKANNGFVSMGNVLGLESGDFSVMAWVKMAAGDTTQSSVIVGKQRAGYANGYLLAANRSEGPTGGYATNNKAWFYDSDYHGQEVTSTTSVNDGEWHQIVGVYVAGANKYIYVDGAPAEASNASRPIVANPGEFVVGGVDFGGVPGGTFTGLIDEVQIYNYALTPTDVDFLFNNPSLELPPFDLPNGWTLNTSVAGGGTIQRNPDLARYPTGTNVTLTAVANTGFAFVGWSGDTRGTNNPVTLTMDGNKTVTASFAGIPLRVLTVVNPDPKQEGEMINFDVKLSSPGDVGGMNFILRYDPVYLKSPQLDWSSTVGSALDQVNYDTPGEIHGAFALPATAVPAGTQRVASVSFRTRSVPFDLNTDLGLELLDVSAPTGDSIRSGNAARSGVARILRRHVIGDNNANNRLDVGDATIIQRLLTGLDPVRPWDVTGNDLNTSTTLDTGDIIRVLRVVAEIDPQPSPQAVGSQSGRLTKADIQKASSSSESLVLRANRLRAQPGELVIVQAVLEDFTAPISGASFTLDYPTNALRLLNSLSLQTGSLVPASAVSVWNVQPAQNNYTVQNGKVSFVASSATQWSLNNGILAEFVFQVQPGQVAQYQWPIRVSDLELTADGYDVRALSESEIRFIGRDPIPPSLDSTSSGWSSNGFRLSLTAESDVAYSIEISSDLVTWLPLTTLTAGSNGTLSFVDHAATNASQRFYRAKQQ
jgi:uncharacterized repeat protein (TIGR02543 family)